ncbi:MAG: hypothetical protein KC445_11300 [Anaerolineales bacterium]|nr:hypothetical protein [Anaerolineales bacterium]MCA9918531.1 hypothetical protein [Anaerolineales bacterium]
MLLTDITQEISALSRIEKILLIERISKMLLEEENPSRYFDSQKTYPVFTPMNQEKAANQLQELLDQQKS